MKNMAITVYDIEQKFESIINEFGKDEIFKYALINAYFNLKNGYKYAGDPCTISMLVCVDEIALTCVSKIHGLEFLAEPWPNSCVINDAYDCSELTVILFRAVQVATLAQGDYDEEYFFESESDYAEKNMRDIIKILTTKSYLINDLHHHKELGLDKNSMLELHVSSKLINNVTE